MEAVELLEIIQRGEDSRHQFKKNIDNQDSLAAEMVAFSNTEGGQLFIGVNDDGTIAGLTSADVRRLNLMISNVSSQLINPAINTITENFEFEKGLVMLVTVPDGISKPYMDKNGTIWIKSGSDKRRATSREEIQRIFQKEGIIHADETSVSGFSYSNIDLDYFSDFFRKQYGKELENQDIPLSRILENMNLAHGGNLDIAGAVLFAKDASFYLPEFIVKAVAFYGVSASDSEYKDKQRISGKLADIFYQTVSFVMQNVPHTQGRQGFNSEAESVVPREVVEELVANALVHRDYFVPSAVKVFVFSDRTEIISPGHLPNNLTIENIKSGNSVSRNPILSSFASRILPYSGIGTGIQRALRLYQDIEFIDEREGNLFKVIINYKKY